MSINRIGPNGKINRDEPSAGFIQIDKQNSGSQKLQEAIQVRQGRNEMVEKAAKMYEKQFLHEMVKAMRSTVDFAQKPSMAENIYRDQLDDQYVDSWGEQGGIGLSDLIYNQVMERFFGSSEGAKIKNEGGMIPLTDRDISRVRRVKSNSVPGQIPLRVEIQPSNEGKPGQIMAPWDGEVVSNSRLEGGKTALTLAHGSLLRSTLVFQGAAAAEAVPGAKLEKGKAIGILSPEVNSFLWNLAQSSALTSSQNILNQDPGPVR